MLLSSFVQAEAQECVQALEDIQTTNLFLVVEPLLVAVSAWDW